MQQLEIGTLTAISREALVPYDASRALLFTHETAAQVGLIAEVCEAVLLQILLNASPGQARVWLYEATPSPQFAQLKALFTASNAVWGKQFFNERDCLKCLAELEELAHRRFALLAQAGVDTITAYNAQASRVEPLIYLLLGGLGETLSETQALRQLQTLCSKGPMVGVIPVLVLGPELFVQSVRGHSDLRHSALLSFYQTLDAACWGLKVFGNGVWQPLQQLQELWRLFGKFKLRVGIDAARRKQWADSLLAKTQVEEDNSAEQDFLRIAIGSTGTNRTYFCMGEKSDVYHGLIGGATRTGKTTLLNNLIINACETYTPQELQLTLLDFKQGGVSFWDYEGLGHVEHLYAPSQDDFDAALLCLMQFEQQLERRYALFRSQRVQRLADYNRVAPEPLPRCLLIADEMQRLFEGREYNQKAHIKRLLSSIAKTGAAAGLHVLLSTLSFQNVDLEQDVKDQFHLRIGLRHASNMGCRALMGRDNGAMLNLERHTAIYNDHQGEESYNRTVALDNLPGFNQRLDALKAKYPNLPAISETPDTIEQEKPTPPKPQDNDPLEESWA